MTSNICFRRVATPRRPRAAVCDGWRVTHRHASRSHPIFHELLHDSRN
jgi:hypothetical protein